MRSFALKPRRLRRCPSVDARILRRVYLCPAPAGAQKRDQRKQERRQENVTKTDPETPPLYLVLPLVSQRKHALILKERSAPIPRRGTAPVPGRAPHSVRMSRAA